MKVSGFALGIFVAAALTFAAVTFRSEPIEDKADCVPSDSRTSSSLPVCKPQTLPKPVSYHPAYL